MNAKMIIVFLLLTGCATNPAIVDNLEKLATPENCFWYGIDVPADAVHTGKIVKKTEPFSMWGNLAALERECGEQYPYFIGGCVKNINGGDWPDPRHSILSFIRKAQGDAWFACPPTYRNAPWKKVVLPETLDDPRVQRLPATDYWYNHKYWDKKVWHSKTAE